MRPRLKRYARRDDGNRVTFVRDPGVEFTLEESDGHLPGLLALLDGNRTVNQVADELCHRTPSLTHGDVLLAINELDAALLIEDDTAPSTLSDLQLDRYASNLNFFSTFATLHTSRFAFQETLCRANVLLLGAGGLGSTVLLNLAGLGVGHVKLVDFDRVELRNFSRQFLYDEKDIGHVKVACAAERVRSFNSQIDVVPIATPIRSSDDLTALVQDVALVLSAIDQPAEVQDWVNKACVLAGVPFVTGGMQVARGVYYSVDPGQSGCLACAKRTGTGPQRPERVNRGIGPVASLMGGLVALEATRYLTRYAPPVSAGRQWIVDFATGETGVAFEWERIADCPVCSVTGSETRAAASAESPR